MNRYFHQQPEADSPGQPQSNPNSSDHPSVGWKRQKPSSTQNWEQLYSGKVQKKEEGTKPQQQLELPQIQEKVRKIGSQKQGSLPISAHREEILKKISENPVVIISGDTGCGKTTQVPQYLLRDGQARNEPVNIICTQPRRMAASSIASRVASELGERVGDCVGYHIGMEHRLGPNTQILFMTTGIFLQRLVNNPEKMKEYTHIIMDEVHERDLDIDFSLVVLKHLLCQIQNGDHQGLKFKLILMSATVNIELFTNYYSGRSIREIEEVQVYVGVEARYEEERRRKEKEEAEAWGSNGKGWDDLSQEDEIKVKPESPKDEFVDFSKNVSMVAPERIVPLAEDPAPVLTISARLYEIREVYIDRLIFEIRQQWDRCKKLDQQREKNYILEAESNRYQDRPSLKEGHMRVASMLICTLLELKEQKTGKPADGVLVFMPGLHEIFEFIDHIKYTYGEEWVSERFMLIPVHSSLSKEEQDKAFLPPSRLNGRRKVIVATNIAESSITIPDIGYVVDFMMTKEMYYDPVTKSESLQLQYASKASCKQRAGRAGRVQNGVVFRLCTPHWYEVGIMDYSKPEMQRCPLEKLILQIKLWNKYDPEQILGRAIQPPEYRDLINAIKNLQATGALTLPQACNQEDSFKPEITGLGRIFVNLPVELKVTRLFLFGMTFNCMHQAIIMGCLHSQTRSLFRNNEDQIGLAQTKCRFDQGRDSDSLLLLQAFLQWQEKFHPEMTPRDDLTPQQFEHSQKTTLKRISPQERNWCKFNFLDLYILRETAKMVKDIKKRFFRMKIGTKKLNSRIELSNVEGVNTLKTCIGGAFYNKYISGFYKNKDMVQRLLKAGKDPNELRRSIILTQLPSEMEPDHIIRFVDDKLKLPAQQIVNSDSRPTIMFAPEVADSGQIKACFKLGLRSSHKRRNNDYDLNRYRGRNYGEAKDALEQILRRPSNPFELLFRTLDGSHAVDFEQESINNVSMEAELDLNPVVFACCDYQDKGGRFMTRSGTKLPRVPMVDVLFCMIFAPVVNVVADPSQKFYSRVVLDYSETLKLTHILTQNDLETIQSLRNSFNEQLCDENWLQKNEINKFIENKTQDLLQTNRIPLWLYKQLVLLRKEQMTLQEIEELEKAKAVEEEIDEAEGILNAILTETGDSSYKPIILPDSPIDEVDEKKLPVLDPQQVPEKEPEEEEVEVYTVPTMKKDRHFLQRIKAHVLTECCNFEPEDVQKLIQEYNSLIKQKKQEIEWCKQKTKSLELKEAILVCEECEQDLCSVRKMKFESLARQLPSAYFCRIFRVEVHEVEESLQDEDDRYSSQKDVVQLFQEEIDDLKQKDLFKKEEETPQKPSSLRYNKAPEQEYRPRYGFARCINYHIIGYFDRDQAVFIDQSPVRIKFPSEEWKHWTSEWQGPGYQKILDLQRRLMKVKEDSYRRRQFCPVTCSLCKIELQSDHGFVEHCKWDKVHLAQVKEFSKDEYLS